MIERLQDWFNPGPVFAWLCLACVPLAVIAWIRHRSRRPGPSVRFSTLSGFLTMPRTLAQRLRFVLPLLRTLAILALGVAMARPQSGGAYVESGEGIAIQMVLDVSGSMREEDFIVGGRRVRRLDAVKKVLREFVLGTGSLRGREGDLIGMTTFAMFADTPCPLTLDHGSLADLLDETEIPGWVKGNQVREDPEAGYTALGDAVVLATDDLRRAGEQAVAGVPGADPAKSQVMILLTDGANNPAPIQGSTPPDPVEAAKVAATLGIKIYTIGAVGGTPAPRSGFSIFQPMRAGVDEELMKRIAEVTGAKYFRATDTESLRTIYDEIDRLERRRTGERSFHDNVYAARAAMLAGLTLLVVEFLLSQTRFRTTP